MIIVYLKKKKKKKDSRTAVKFSSFMHYFKTWPLRVFDKFDTDGLYSLSVVNFI